MRNIKTIYVHHSASPVTDTIDDIERYHKDRGFRTVGYNYVIHYDGSMHAGRPEDEIPAQVKGHNKYSLGICLIGNTSKLPPSIEQIESIEVLLDHLIDKYDLTRSDVLGHRESAPTECPGDGAFDWLQNWRSR